MPKKSHSKTKIVLTGGHAATTALSVIEKLNGEGAWDIFWIGAKTPIEGKNLETLESKVYPKLGIKTYTINAGKIQRKINFWAFVSIAKIPLGFIEAFLLIYKIRPKIILSFGGFAAFPVVFAGFVLNIHSVLHEQTMAVGLANKFSGFFVKKVGVARSESSKFFPKEKTVLVGNPIGVEVLKVKPKYKIGHPPNLLILGGSRGSQTINKAVGEVLEKILKNFKLVHLTGDLDFNYFLLKKGQLPPALAERYEVTSFLSPQKLARKYQESDIIISRAGANTVSEILFIRRPAILIPIPWVRYNEQNLNALLAKNAGIAKILPQEDLTGETLLGYILETQKNWGHIIKNMKTSDTKLDQEASVNLVNLVKSLL